MPISDVVNIAITVAAAGPVGAGFGEPLLLAYHTRYTDRVREYSSLQSVGADFQVTDAAYLMAQSVFAQTPSPANVKIGRRALPPTQTLKITCLSAVNTDTYSFQLRTPGGSWKQVTVASTGVPGTDAGTVAAAVTALAITGLTASHTASNAYFTITMAAGSLIDLKPDTTHCQLADTTADPGLATDLAAIIAADNNWYGLGLDSNSPAEIGAAAAWAEANNKLFVANCSDTEIADPASVTDIAYTLKQSAYARTALLFAQTQTLCYSGCAWMGRMFPTTAGSENWAFKTLAGVPADTLTDGQVHAVENKNASVYTALAGVNATQFGKQPGGEWIDVTRGTDALKNDMQIGILSLQLNSLKVPYTDAGIDMYRSVISATLKKYVDIGFLSDTPAPYVSIPSAAAQGTPNRVARTLANVTFSAQLAGAINSTSIQGVLST